MVSIQTVVKNVQILTRAQMQKPIKLHPHGPKFSCFLEAPQKDASHAESFFGPLKKMNILGPTLSVVSSFERFRERVGPQNGIHFKPFPNLMRGRRETDNVCELSAVTIL